MYLCNSAKTQPQQVDLLAFFWFYGVRLLPPTYVTLAQEPAFCLCAYRAYQIAQFPCVLWILLRCNTAACTGPLFQNVTLVLIHICLSWVVELILMRHEHYLSFCLKKRQFRNFFLHTNHGWQLDLLIEFYWKSFSWVPTEGREEQRPAGIQHCGKSRMGNGSVVSIW